MPLKFEGSVMQVGNSLRITIPQEIAKHLSIERGDAVELWVENHSMIMEKKVFVYDAIWSFQEDILATRGNIMENIKAHTSQPIGIPLHRFKGQLCIEREQVTVTGEDVTSHEPATVLFSLENVKDLNLGWDDTMRRWRDTRALIRPLRIVFQDEAESKTIYLYAKKPEGSVYGGENESIMHILTK
jgi:antitoxin component of MazEF toxin-antitoxin module